MLALATSGAYADLVAKWDFNNYDPSDPKSANVLQATIGSDAKPRFKNGKGSDPTSDGSLGEMSIVSTGLDVGNYAISIPRKSHVALPIPDSVKNHAWAMKIRFYLPEGGKYHTFFNRSNLGDGDLFTNDRSANALGFSGSSGYSSFKNNYQTSVTAGGWHTLTISAGDQRCELILDGTILAIYNNSDNLKNYFNTTEALTDIDGVGHLLLCADENGEDNLMYIDYVELYDNAIFNPIISLTGEWNFSNGNELKAMVGSNLEKYTSNGNPNFTTGANSGIDGDDGYVCAGRYNYFKCYHSLPAESDYTVVMDVRIPDTDNGRQVWHALFKGTDNNTDADVFIKKENDGLKIRTIGENMIPLGADFGEWVRLAIVYRNGVSKTVYANGVKKCTAINVPERMVSTANGYFLLLGDNDGEDWDVDISYAAIYYGAFSDGEVAAFHSTPLGVSSYASSEIAPETPTISVTTSSEKIRAGIDAVTFIVSATHSAGEYLRYEIDFGDGFVAVTEGLVASGAEVQIEHIYTSAGTYKPSVKAVSQYGVGSASTVGSDVVVSSANSGVTTVEVGTPLIVLVAIDGENLEFTIPDGLADGVYEVIVITGGEMFADDVLEHVVLPDDEKATFRLRADKTAIYCVYGIIEPTWIGGVSGNLSAAANWTSGAVPTDNAVISVPSAAKLTVGETFSPSTITIPDDSAIVTIGAGDLTVATLTNACKLAIASGASLTVTGDLVVCDGKGTFLYSNEGFVTVGCAVCAKVTSVATAKQYEVVTESTNPIRTGGFIYDTLAYWRMESNATGAGSWIVGEDGFKFKNLSSSGGDGYRFYAQNSPVTLYSSADWTLDGTGLPKTTRGDMQVYDSSSLIIDTSDYDSPTIPHRVTLKGRINAYGPVTIKGCGAVVVDTVDMSNVTGIEDDLKHTWLKNGVTLSVTDTATLRINAGKKITGNGKVSLAAGTTLALDSSALGAIGDVEFVPCIPGLALPTTGAATIRINGRRLRSGDHVVATVVSGTAANVVPDLSGTALNGRRASFRVDNGILVFNIQSNGTKIVVR